MASPLSNSLVRARVQPKLLGIIKNVNGDVKPEAGAAPVPKVRPLYLEFLNEMCFANSAESCNPQLLEGICSRVTALCRPSVPPGIIAMSALFGEMAYRYHPFELQVKIAHFTALMIFVDDMVGLQEGEERQRFLEDLTLFHYKFTAPEGYAKLYPGRGDLHPVLEDTIIFFQSEQSPFFGTDHRLHSQMVKCYLEFLDGNMLEEHYRENPVDFAGQQMTLLPTTLRRKSGIAEPYACFTIMNTAACCRSKEEERFFYNKLYPLVPHLIAVIEYVNDVLSFYKEMENGEHDSCIVTDARAHGVSPEEALEVYAQYCVDARRRIIAIVDKAESAEMMRNVLQFFQGYLVFHVGNRRYRMNEVLPHGWYNGDVFGS